MLARLDAAATAQRRAGLFDHELVEQAFLLVHGAVDALDALAGDDVVGQLGFDLVEATIVDLAKTLEGRHELVEGGVDIVRHGLDFRRGILVRGFTHAAILSRADGV